MYSVNIWGDFVSEPARSKVHGIPLHCHFDWCTKKPSNRTKHSHPYSYDNICVYAVEKQATGGAYSDRMIQWDYEKFERLNKEHFGNRSQYWSDRSPNQIEAFLRDYFDKPNLQLVLVIESCNQASGYPVWYFGYNDAEVSASDKNEAV